jgi:hypothetical protein
MAAINSSKMARKVIGLISSLCPQLAQKLPEPSSLQFLHLIVHQLFEKYHLAM